MELPTEACPLGNLVPYSIYVTGAADVTAGPAFERPNNICLVVKNTGHE
jgi:hypothetical protein